MNIYDFIQDDFQFALKQQASNGRKRFEDVLGEYKRLFMDELNNCNAQARPQNLHPNLLVNQSVIDWIDCFRQNVFTDIDNIEKLFDEIIEGYFLFVNSKHYLASLNYQNILEKYDLLVDEDLDRLGLFFRGFPKGNRDASDIEQYYHIPFDLRRFVNNQRFSFSGIPLVYLGASIADIYFELDEFDLNSNKLAIASFAFNPISAITVHTGYNTVTTKTKVFNITNEIYNLINKHFLPIINSGANLPDCNNQKYGPNGQHLIIYFRKFIVSQLCTFPKRFGQQNFIEEYVIPQLFTEALRLHKYDGIIFPSTKFSQQNVVLNGPPYHLGYKENLVMFTDYSQTNRFDEMLIDNFHTEIKSFRGYGRANYTQILNDIITANNDDIPLLLVHKERSAGKRRIQQANMSIGSRISLYQNLTINGTQYLDTRAGKLDLIYTREYMRYLKSCIPYLNNV